MKLKLKISTNFTLWFAYHCHLKLISGKKSYSWYLLALPNWRWHLVNNLPDEFGKRYSAPKEKPTFNRVELFKINGYKYKLFKP